MKNYQHIFFDLDHTLWDFDKNAEETLNELYFTYKLSNLGLDESVIPAQFEDDYVNICPTKSNLFQQTHETLSYLKQKYKLHLISNGFKESTEYKVKNTHLTPYFENVIISEVVGINKPDKVIFQYAVDKAGTHSNESLMIGDSIEADVRGALNFGMDAIYFNPNFTEIPEDINWHINHLEELTLIL